MTTWRAAGSTTGAAFGRSILNAPERRHGIVGDVAAEKEAGRIGPRRIVAGRKWLVADTFVLGAA
jgi:hypothetical protein